MIYLKTDEEIELLRAANQIVARTLAEVAKVIAPGVTTLKLDTIAEEYIRSQGAVPGFKGYGGFPGTLCVSVNENVVHGIPSNYALREGDIVSVDCGAVKDGYNGDSTYTFCVGEVEEEVKRLLRTTKESLYIGIEHAVEMCGHGVGRKLHEDPDVPNYGRKGTGPLIKNGMVIAIEPMINMGSKNIVIERDGWTTRTKDRKPSAHYEHTIAIHHGKPDILSSFQYVEEVLGDRSI